MLQGGLNLVTSTIVFSSVIEASRSRRAAGQLETDTTTEL
jgi:hypothetical protein